MRSAAREGASAHLPVMGVICGSHIALPIPSSRGCEARITQTWITGAISPQREKALIRRWG